MEIPVSVPVAASDDEQSSLSSILSVDDSETSASGNISTTASIPSGNEIHPVIVSVAVSEDEQSSNSGLSSILTVDDSENGGSGNVSTTTSTSSSRSGNDSSGEIHPVIDRVSLDRDLSLSLKTRCVGSNNGGASWGFSSIIGRRKEMEDAVAIVPRFMSLTCSNVGGCTASGGLSRSVDPSPVHFFGVYDGHGGSQVANFCADRMHGVIAEEWEQKTCDGCEWQRKWETTLSSGFEKADNEVTKGAVAPDMVGSTAVVVVLSSCQIITSNCGDSRAVLCRGTQTIPLTVDQKPDRPDELLRIEAEGGKVINWDGARVLGVLAMSRAIGDRYLRPWIIPVPEVTFTTRSDEDECLILASDGLWDVMTNKEVGEVARRLLKHLRRSTVSSEIPPAQAVAECLSEIAYNRNSCDNISIIVVDLKPRRRRRRSHSHSHSNSGQ